MSTFPQLEVQNAMRYTLGVMRVPQGDSIFAPRGERPVRLSSHTGGDSMVVVVRCRFCGKKFKRQLCWVKRIKNQTCSKSCRFKFRDYTGNKNPNWKGARITMQDGRVAVYAPGHPGAVLFGGTHILEYRLLIEKKIGRSLRRNEIVHHINGDPTDNRLSNLEVMTQSEHCREHMLGNKHGSRKNARHA